LSKWAIPFGQFLGNQIDRGTVIDFCVLSSRCILNMKRLVILKYK